MRLKELRIEKEKNQIEVANFLNISQASYSRYEMETSEPTIDTLCKLADYYDTSLDYLVGRNYRNEFAYLNEQEKVILTAFKQMSNDNKSKFIAEAQGILIAQS